VAACVPGCPGGRHRLRHALASEMLRRGSHLTKISQVLRHLDLATTLVRQRLTGSRCGQWRARGRGRRGERLGRAGGGVPAHPPEARA
jgi:hypothetical protein